MKAALLTCSWPKDGWLPVLRPYTPITSSGRQHTSSILLIKKKYVLTFVPDETGHLDLLVKQYPNGKASTHLHSLQPGQTLLFVAPLGGHKWEPNSHKHVTLIAGGAGITPIYQLARGILDNPADATAVTVVFGVNTERDILFEEEFQEYEKKFPGRFRAVYTVSEGAEGSKHAKGRVTEALLRETAPEAGADTMAFVCGPPGMEEALLGKGREMGILERMGYSKKQIYKF